MAISVSEMYKQYELYQRTRNDRGFDEDNFGLSGGGAFRTGREFSLKYPQTVGGSLSGNFVNYNSNQSSVHAKNMAKNHIDKDATEPFVFFEFMSVLPKDKYKQYKSFYKRKEESTEITKNTSITSASYEQIETALLGNTSNLTRTVSNIKGESVEEKVKPGSTIKQAASAASEKGFMKPVLREFKGSIAMYMPTDIQINDTLVYNEQSRKTFGTLESALKREIQAESAQSLAITGGMIAAGSAIGFLAEKFSKGSTSTFGKIAADKGTEAGTFLGAAGTGVVLDEYQRSSGKATNPHEYMAYGSTGLRSFSYTFTFLPDSKQESDEVVEIIKQFRHAAHASVIDGLKVQVPEHVVVTHHGAGNMIQLPPLVIESVNVTYNPNNASYFIEGNNPVEVGLSITLKEIVPIYKEDIDGGM
jgi:hypothetical protein